MGLPDTVASALKSTNQSSQEFREAVCLPFLRQAQNADGGWGYRPATGSAVEATAWCLLALAQAEPGGEAVRRGLAWLAGAQCPDGSWPTRPETQEGNWVTALAGLALAATNAPPAALSSAARWICQSRSMEGGFRSRVMRLLPGKRAVEQSLTLRGWSWTPGTASWVEPTAAALIFLHALPPEILPENAAERRETGEAMLYNRMCPGGGWNSGNPKVYGVAGIPLYGPTAWALLALQARTEREENRLSLDWLASRFGAIGGPTSLALSCLALDAAGRPAPDFERILKEKFEAGDFQRSVMAFAQACFALGPGPDLLRWAPQEN